MGIIGNLLGSAIEHGGDIGRVVGGVFGDAGRGQQIGSAIQGSGLASLARMLPFQEGGVVPMNINRYQQLYSGPHKGLLAVRPMKKGGKVKKPKRK